MAAIFRSVGKNHKVDFKIFHFFPHSKTFLILPLSKLDMKLHDKSLKSIFLGQVFSPFRQLWFGQGLFFKVWTHFLGGNDRDQNSLIRFKIFFILSFYLGLDVDIHISKKYSLVFTTEIIFYSSSLLGVFGARRDLNSKTKVKSSISKLLAWTL